MQPQNIYDRSKSRAMAWALQQPNGLRCTICGATGPTLTLADIDFLHTRFVARCHQHIETAPRILSVYALVLEKRKEPSEVNDALWFKANPQRTHRLRQILPDERERHPRSGELMLVRKLAHGDTDQISVWASDHQTVVGDDDLLTRMFDQLRGKGPGICSFMKRSGGAA